MKCPYKNGERIVCIYDTLKVGFRVIDRNCIGKVYEVVMTKLPSGANFIFIKSVSSGRMFLSADWSNYISLNEQRKQKLEKINDTGRVR